MPATRLPLRHITEEYLRIVCHGKIACGGHVCITRSLNRHEEAEPSVLLLLTTYPMLLTSDAQLGRIYFEVAYTR